MKWSQSKQKKGNKDKNRNHYNWNRKTVERINKKLFFGKKINKINKPLARLTKIEKTQITNIRETGYIPADSTATDRE